MVSKCQICLSNTPVAAISTFSLAETKQALHAVQKTSHIPHRRVRVSQKRTEPRVNGSKQRDSLTAAQPFRNINNRKNTW
jgi:hypothetical protein